MKPQFKIAIYFLFAVLLGQAFGKNINSPDSEFNNFVKHALAGFSSWADSKGLEPSPMIPYPVNLTIDASYINVTGIVRNQILSNYTDFEASVVSNLEINAFGLTLDKQGFSSFGLFEFEGIYYSSVPVKVEGTGRFILANEEAKYQHKIFFNHYGITSDGYVDLTVSDVWQSANLYEVKPLFPGLAAGGLEQEVSMHLTRRYQDGGDANFWLRLGEHVSEYLGEVFAETPLADIIGNGTVISQK